MTCLGNVMSWSNTFMQWSHCLPRPPSSWHPCTPNKHRPSIQAHKQRRSYKCFVYDGRKSHSEICFRFGELLCLKYHPQNVAKLSYYRSKIQDNSTDQRPWAFQGETSKPWAGDSTVKTHGWSVRLQALNRVTSLWKKIQTTGWKPHAPTAAHSTESR